MSTERKETITIEKDKLSTSLVTQTIKTERELFSDIQEARNRKVLEEGVNTSLGALSSVIASVMLSAGLVGVLDFESLAQKGLGFLLISGGSIATNTSLIFLRRTRRAQRQLEVIRINR